MTADELAKYIGCKEAVWMDFDHGGQLGVGATWEVRKAVRVQATGDLDADLKTAADQLIEWRKAQA
jgi:hypothetical protein